MNPLRIDRRRVRGWRRTVRAVVKRDTDLRQETKRVRRAARRRPTQASWLIRIIVAVLIGGFAVDQRHRGLAIDLFGWWAVLSTLWRAVGFRDAQRDPRRLLPLSLVPIADGDVFGDIVRREAWPLAFLAVEAAALVIGACAGSDGPAWRWAAVPAWAVAHVLVAAAVAAWAGILVPGRALGLATFLLTVASGFTAFILLKELPLREVLVDPLLTAISRGTPAGWLQQVLPSALVGDRTAWLLPLGLSACAAAALAEALVRLRRRFAMPMFFDLPIEHAADAPPGADGNDDQPAQPVADRDAPDRPVDATALLARWATLRAAPVGEGLRGSRIGRLVARMLTPRQLFVADLLGASASGWDRRWRNGAILLAGALATNSAGMRAGIPSALAIFAVLAAVPLLGGDWPLIGQRDWQGTSLWAFAPLRFGECARVILTANLVRSLLGAPIVVTAVAVIGSLCGLPVDDPAVLGAKAFALLLISLPATLVVRCWGVVNDTRRVGLMGLVRLAFLVIAGFIVLMIAAMFCAPRLGWPASIGMGVAMAAITLGVLAAFARTFRRGRFDLIQQPLPTG